MATARSTREPNTNALVYCRVSTKGQEEGTSLESQEAACVKHAHDHGYTVAQVTREVYSGAELFDRPQLSRDREAIRAGEYGALVFYALDRLSRDPIHMALLEMECERAGCVLLCVTEPLDTGHEAELVRYVKGYAARLEREKIRERNVRGKRQRALNGKVHNAGPELYGYRRDKAAGVRTVYEPEAMIVRQIFAWVTEEHIGAKAVARRLNNQGVPPPSAGKMTYEPDRQPRWAETQIRKMLRHPAYKGDSFAWRTQRPSSATDRQQKAYDGHEGRLIRPREEWIKLPEHVTPALVSSDVWQAAQDVIAERKAAAATRNAARPHLLRGMVRCGVCGRAMYSNIETYGNHRADIYRCSSRARGARCGGGRINAALVEAWVWESVCTILREPDRIASELQRRQSTGADATLTSDLETARRRIATLGQKQANLMERYTASTDDSFPWELVMRQIKHMENEKVQWQKQASEIEKRLEEETVSLQQLVSLQAYCERVAGNLDSFGFEERRMALEALQIRLVGNGDEWTLYGSIPTDDGGPWSLEHNIRMLCEPQAATSRARLTCSWPRTSARS